MLAVKPVAPKPTGADLAGIPHCFARSGSAADIEMHTPAIKLLNAAHAATLLGVRVTTLESWRLRGTGPRYRKIGRLVRYVEADVLAWIEAQVRTSTSQKTSKNALA